MHTTDTELRMYNTFKIVPRADNDNDNGGGGGTMAIMTMIYLCIFLQQYGTKRQLAMLGKPWRRERPNEDRQQFLNV